MTRREIISAKIYDSESEIECESFLDDLTGRDLKGIELIILYEHRSIQDPQRYVLRCIMAVSPFSFHEKPHETYTEEAIASDAYLLANT